MDFMTRGGAAHPVWWSEPVQWHVLLGGGIDGEVRQSRMCRIGTYSQHSCDQLAKDVTLAKGEKLTPVTYLLHKRVRTARSRVRGPTARGRPPAARPAAAGVITVTTPPACGPLARSAPCACRRGPPRPPTGLG